MDLLSTALAAGVALADSVPNLPGEGLIEYAQTQEVKQRADVQQWATRWRASFVDTGVALDSVRIVFSPPQDRPGDVPLSWKLSARQKEGIAAAWQQIVAGTVEGPRPLEILDEYFPPSSRP
jgi:hypothetical protein